MQPATSQPNKKKFQERTIIFTEFNYGESPEDYLRTLQEKCTWVYGQLEKCPETGRLHIQGMAYSKTNSKWGFCSGWKKKCYHPLAHLDYCSKTETRVDGPWEFGDRPTWNVKGQKTNLY